MSSQILLRIVPGKNLGVLLLNGEIDMAEKFEREDRYFVLKISDLKKMPKPYMANLSCPLSDAISHLPDREYAVVESDWPEYEAVWRMIESRVTGKPIQDLPRLAVMAAATQVIVALKADGTTDGYHLEAGMFGPEFSKLLRRWAAAEWIITHARTQYATEAEGDAYATGWFESREQIEPLDRNERTLLYVDVLGFGDSEFQDINRHDLDNLVDAIERRVKS